MLKIISLMIGLLMMSGCCELFGVCTSVAVHSSISTPDKLVGAQFNNPVLPASANETQMLPGSTLASNPRYLPPN